MSSSLEDSQAWMTWIETVSAEDRAQVASIVAQHDTESWSGLRKFTNELTKSMLLGLVAPIAVDTLLKLLDRQMATLFMEHKEANALEHYPMSMTASMVELKMVAERVKPVTATYFEKPPVEDADVLESFGNELPSLPKFGADEG